MPSNGLQIFGSGIQLQPGYPTGFQQQGNANISGVFHAARFTTTPPANDAGNTTGEEFGHGNTWQGGAVPGVTRVLVFAVGSTINWPGTIGMVAGLNNIIQGQNVVSVGEACSAGNSANLPANLVAMGLSVSVSDNSNGITDTVAGTTGVGNQIEVHNGSVAFGRSIVVRNGNNANNDNFAYGYFISLIQTNGGCGAIGRGISITNQNCLVIGWYNSDQPVMLDNMILIGRPDQTNVRIGAINFTNGAGTLTRSVNDANIVVGPTDGKILMTAITAARTCTLPLANSVPAGFAVKVIDTSGNLNGVRTITAAVQGADTLNGSTPMNAAYDAHEWTSDGISKWIQTLDTH